jgi:L-amino acid N-acyltransferase YncA
MNSTSLIRPVNTSDCKAIMDIYNHFVIHSHSTFETIPVSEKEMQTRIDIIKKEYPFFVFENEDGVVAYAYASRWKTRQAYDFTVESSIYVKPGFEGRKIGITLYSKLIDELRKTSIHSVLGGISLPNEASITLHEKLGFKHAGVLKEVGFKLGRWIDVAYLELLL